MTTNAAAVRACRAAAAEYGEYTTIHSFLKYGKDGMKQRNIMPWNDSFINKHQIFLVARDYAHCVLDGKFNDTEASRKIFAFGSAGKLPLEDSRTFNWRPYIKYVEKSLNIAINQIFKKI